MQKKTHIFFFHGLLNPDAFFFIMNTVRLQYYIVLRVS